MIRLRVKASALLAYVAVSLGACGIQDITGEDFADYVKSRKVGAANDYMLQMRNDAGEWEPVMFVFGYATTEGTRVECQNAADGLKKVNFAREYRCVLANLSTG